MDAHAVLAALLSAKVCEVAAAAEKLAFVVLDELVETGAIQMGRVSRQRFEESSIERWNGTDDCLESPSVATPS